MNISFAKFMVYCISLILLVTVSPVHAQKEGESDPAYIFYKANALYEEGKYDEAIKYTKLIL